MDSVLQALFSFSTFIFLFYWFSGILKLYILKLYPRRTILEISNKLVSAIHSVVAVCVGCVIVSETKWDPIRASHSLASVYPWIAVGYGVYDIWSMGYVFLQRNRSLVLESGYLAAMYCFGRIRLCMLLHHLLLLICIFPVVTWYRNGKGDFFVGCFLLTELSTPLVCARAVLNELGMKKTKLYAVNGVAMIALFTVCRILIFPYMFQRYADYKKVPLRLAFHSVPKKCSFACLVIFCFQAYWLHSMLVGAKKIIWGKDYNGVDEDVNASKSVTTIPKLTFFNLIQKQ